MTLNGNQSPGDGMKAIGGGGGMKAIGGGGGMWRLGAGVPCTMCALCGEGCKTLI